MAIQATKQLGDVRYWEFPPGSLKTRLRSLFSKVSFYPASKNTDTPDCEVGRSFTPLNSSSSGGNSVLKYVAGVAGLVACAVLGYCAYRDESGETETGSMVLKTAATLGGHLLAAPAIIGSGIAALELTAESPFTQLWQTDGVFNAGQQHAILNLQNAPSGMSLTQEYAPPLLTIPVGGTVYDIACESNLCAVADFGGPRVWFFDLSNPLNPTLQNEISSLAGQVRFVYSLGNGRWMAGTGFSGSVQIFNQTDVLGTLGTTSTSYQGDCFGSTDTCLIAANTEVLSINASGSTPVLYDSLAVAEFPRRVRCLSSSMCVVAGQFTARVINVTDPSNLSALGNSLFASQLWGVECVLSSSICYLPAGVGGGNIYSISVDGSGAIAQLDDLPLPGPAIGITCEPGGMVCMASGDGTNGIYFYEADPLGENLKLDGFVSTNATARTLVRLNQGYWGLANNNEGLSIVNFRDSSFEIRWTPGPNAEGDYNWQLSAKNGAFESTLLQMQASVAPAISVNGFIPEQRTTVDEYFAYGVPNSVFVHWNDSSLTIVMQVDDTLAASTWLSFDGNTIFGTPPNTGSGNVTLIATDTFGANATLTFPLIVEPDRLAQLLLGMKIGSIALSVITVPLTLYKFRVKAWNWCCQKRHRKSQLQAHVDKVFTHTFSNPRIQTVRVRELTGGEKQLNLFKPPGKRLANFENIPEGWEWNRARNTVTSNRPISQGPFSQAFYLDGRDKHKRIIESRYVEVANEPEPGPPASEVASASIASASDAVELKSEGSSN